MRKKEIAIKKSTSKTKIGVAGLFGIGAVVAAAILLTRKKSPTCKTGERWDETLKLCVVDEVVHTCPTNQHWNGTACVFCPYGYHWDKWIQDCVSDEHWCGTGAHWDEAKGMCVLNDGYTCPSGTNWDGEACVTCATGWHWNEQLLQCVRDAPCPVGQHWDSNRGACVPNVVKTCPVGTFLDDRTGLCSSLDLNGDGVINVLDLTLAKISGNSDDWIDSYTQAWLLATFGY